MASSNEVTRTIREGDAGKEVSKRFTICIIANPALEAPWNSGAFITDPITGDQAAFDACVQYIDTSLFGGLPNQSEQAFADPSISQRVRVVSLFVPGLPAQDSNSLVGQDDVSNLLIARRSAFSAFLAQFGLGADVAYAVSKSASHTRASAWFTSDDTSRSGVNFTLDGVARVHCYYNLTPGTVALHCTAYSLTALHEFGHALSSYENGMVVDLYVDSNPGLNCKRGRPIAASFGTYNQSVLLSDMTRDRLGYPSGWQSYHCELNAPSLPAVMDDYWLAPDGVPEHCEHDAITRRFLLDRILAKLAR
jgi:hypothetical protein